MNEGLSQRIKRIEDLARRIIPSPRCQCTEPVTVTVDVNGRPECERCGGSVNVKDIQLPPGAVPPATAEE
jgi:hypothetical protein